MNAATGLHPDLAQIPLDSAVLTDRGSKCLLLTVTATCLESEITLIEITVMPIFQIMKIRLKI